MGKRGRGTSSQLGHGDMVSIFRPKHVKSLENLIITHVSAGWSHSSYVLGSLSLSWLGSWDLNIIAMITEYLDEFFNHYLILKKQKKCGWV